MRRVVIVTLVTFIFAAAWQALSLKLSHIGNLFFIAPLVLVFAVQFLKPIEVMPVGLLCGVIIDVLGGFPIGLNMLLLVNLGLLLGVFKVFSGRISRRELVYYVMVISFLYRLILLLVNLVLFYDKANIFVVPLLLGPIFDGLISVIFYPLLVRVLSLFKVFDQNDYFRNRIGLRS